MSIKEKKSLKKKLFLLCFFVLLVLLSTFYFLFKSKDNVKIEEITVSNQEVNINKETNTNYNNSFDLENSWLYVSEDIRISVSNNQNNDCEVVWLSESGKTIELFTINSNLEEENIASFSNTDNCLINKKVSTSDYIGVKLDGKKVGGMEAPLTFTASTVYAMFTLPDNPTTLYPTSGYWKYEAGYSSMNLTCATAMGAVGSEGTVEFTTSNDGFTASLNAEDSSIHFNRLAYDMPKYKTPEYSFPLEDGVGSVKYELEVVDQDEMTGMLHMKGDVCNGDFPIIMTLQTPTEPIIYVPHQGSWSIQYPSIMCGAAVINPGSLANLIFDSSTLSVTGGGPAPMNLNFSGSPNSLMLSQSPDTNIYNSFPNMWLGTATDANTGAFNVMGTITATALSDSLIMGTLMITGTNGCVGATSILFEHY